MRARTIRRILEQNASDNLTAINTSYCYKKTAIEAFL